MRRPSRHSDYRRDTAALAVPGPLGEHSGHPHDCTVTCLRRPGEYERRDPEFDRFRVDTLRAPARFSDTIASDEETVRLGIGGDLLQVGPNSLTVALRLATRLRRVEGPADGGRVLRGRAGA